MLVSSNTNTVSASRCAPKSMVLPALYNGFRWAGRLLNVIHLLTASSCCGNIETPRNMLWCHNVSTTRPFLLFSHASVVALIDTKPVKLRNSEWISSAARVNCATRHVAQMDVGYVTTAAARTHRRHFRCTCDKTKSSTGRTVDWQFAATATAGAMFAPTLRQHRILSESWLSMCCEKSVARIGFPCAPYRGCRITRPWK